MGRKKLVNILAYAIGFSVLVVYVYGFCPDSQICSCTTESIKCICLHREEIIFFEGQEEQPFTGEELMIKGCGKIELDKLSLMNLNVNLVHMSDLLELYIEPYAFGQSSIRNLYISDITIFNLASHGLGNIKDLSNLTISNATFENLVPALLADTEAENVAIINSHIGTIQSRALHMQNVETFLMRNNVINAFDLTSIAVKNVKKFNFTRNSVSDTSFGSMTLSMVDEVYIEYCSFRYIHASMIITKDIETFSFHNNYVETCDERAFWSIQAGKRIRFVNNRILVANDDSLFPNLGPNVINLHDPTIIETNNNSFSCNCHLEWLFINKNPTYDLIMENNFCHSPEYLADFKLSQLIMVLDNTHTCSSIEGISTTDITTSTSTAMSITAERKSLPTFISISTEKELHAYIISSSPQVTTIASTESSIKLQKFAYNAFSSTQVRTISSTESNIKEKYRSQNNSADRHIGIPVLTYLLLSFTVWWL